jgi:hypothetical protein
LVQCSRHFLCHTLDVCWKVRSTDFTTAWWRTFWMRKAKIYLCLNYLTFPHNSCIKNKMRVREAEGIFKIEVHKCTWQRKENCDRKSTGTWPTLPPLFFAIFFHTLLNIILVSNNLKSTIFFSILIYLPILLSSYFYDLVYYYIGDIKNGHGNLNFLNGFFFIIFFMFNAW